MSCLKQALTSHLGCVASESAFEFSKLANEERNTNFSVKMVHDAVFIDTFTELMKTHEKVNKHLVAIEFFARSPLSPQIHPPFSRHSNWFLTFVGLFFRIHFVSNWIFFLLIRVSCHESFHVTSQLCTAIEIDCFLVNWTVSTNWCLNRPPVRRFFIHS